jgi:hypothetical protein
LLYAAAQNTGPEITAEDSAVIAAHLADGISLKPHQRRAVRWMKDAETGFLLTAINEEQAWRSWGGCTQTWRDRCRSRPEGGGVLADEPGLGT